MKARVDACEGKVVISLIYHHSHDVDINHIAESRIPPWSFRVASLSRMLEIAEQPTSWSPKDLSQIVLYSIVVGRRIKELIGMNKAPLARKLGIRLCQSKTISHVAPRDVIWTLIGKKYCILKFQSLFKIYT